MNLSNNGMMEAKNKLPVQPIELTKEGKKELPVQPLLWIYLDSPTCSAIRAQLGLGRGLGFTHE